VGVKARLCELAILAAGCRRYDERRLPLELLKTVRVCSLLPSLLTQLRR
jgi:hypothetical protein